MAKVAVVGSTMVEQFTYCARAPAAGETVEGERTAMGWGGKGANQAVMASNLGADVALITCLGDDPHGALYREHLQRVGVDTTYVHTAAGTSSGVAPIWVEADGTNRIIIVPGANNHLSAEQAVAALEAISPTVVIGQFEIPQDVTAAAFAAAKRLGAVTLLNPAPAAPIDAKLLRVTDWVIPNETEFEVLAGGAPTDELIKEFGRRVGVRLLVTLGAAGVARQDSDGAVWREPPPATPNVVDTTGAGDAFVGGFGFGLASGMAEIDAVQLGMACASDSVTREGTQTAFPTRERCQSEFLSPQADKTKARKRKATE